MTHVQIPALREQRDPLTGTSYTTKRPEYVCWVWGFLHNIIYISFLTLFELQLLNQAFCMKEETQRTKQKPKKTMMSRSEEQGRSCTENVPDQKLPDLQSFSAPRTYSRFHSWIAKGPKKNWWFARVPSAAHEDSNEKSRADASRIPEMDVSGFSRAGRESLKTK